MKAEARRLLPIMLSLPRWRNAIDLTSAEARSIATVLFQEESAAAAVLSVGETSSWDEVRDICWSFHSFGLFWGGCIDLVFIIGVHVSGQGDLPI